MTARGLVAAAASLVARLGAAYAVVALAILVAGWTVPADGGPMAVANLLSPHLALASATLVPVAVLARSRALAAVLLAIVAVFAARFGAEWTSPAPAAASPTSAELRVATWNLEAGAQSGAGAVEMLRDHPSDIVVLVELSGPVAEAIEADGALRSRYPHRSLHPSASVLGMGILSRYPLADPAYDLHPVRLESRVLLPGGELVVLGAHPFHPEISLLGGLPVGLDADDRNRDLERLRGRVAELEADGRDVLLIGDFNTAPTEPAFPRLTEGLNDAHAEVGSGPGWTWRPRSLAFLGIGLLRIDLILSTADLRPIRTDVDCPRIGDHCLVDATFERSP